LKVERDAVPFSYTEVDQGRSEGITHLIEFPVRDDLLEVIKGRTLTLALNRLPEVVQSVCGFWG
jgi:hypothetical protein